MSCVCPAFASVYCCLVVTWTERTDLLTICLWCLLWFCYFPFWYPGTGVVLDCINSWSLLSFWLNWKVILQSRLSDIFINASNILIQLTILLCFIIRMLLYWWQTYTLVFDTYRFNTSKTIPLATANTIEDTIVAMTMVVLISGLTIIWSSEI